MRLITGVVSGLLVIGSPANLFIAGYRRVLFAKVVLAIALVALGRRNRTIWLPVARTHHAGAEVSRRWWLTELVVMLAALTFAAALVVTG